MSLTTSGVAPRTGNRTLRDLVELLSSMRFAISLLTLICIASVAVIPTNGIAPT